MTGWIADFFLLWWAMIYWNARKTWFRLTGAHRDACPCQHYSDSGHALDSRCVAVAHWRDPARFRRVCPLLTHTKDGWRCGVDAERVRPFWGRAALFAGLALLLVYAGGTLAAFAVLRATGHEVGYLSLVWPPHWGKVRGSQEKLFATRAQEALAKGDYQAAMLALQKVCAINPRNYGAAMTLASLSQASGQPSVAEHIYKRLMREVPEQRIATAQIWLRSLLARAEFEQTKQLAATMLSEDSAKRAAWLHALLFACRQTRDRLALEPLAAPSAGLPDWCAEIIRTELLLLQGETGRAALHLSRIHRRAASPYLPYYQADRLIALGRYLQAAELIAAYGPGLPAEEASFLRLRFFTAQQWTALVEGEYELLLARPMTAALAAQFCAWMMSNPDRAAFARYADKFLREGPALSHETLPLYHAGYLSALLCADQARAARFQDSVVAFTASDARALISLGELLAKGGGRQQFIQLLPLVALPLEVTYALIERIEPPAKR